jgi:hypothetical protein
LHAEQTVGAFGAIDLGAVNFLLANIIITKTPPKDRGGNTMKTSN